MGKLTVAGVRNAKPGRHADGDGLYLLVKPTGARSWLLRVQVEKRRRDIGLGSVDLTPKPDRDKAIDDIPLLNRKMLSLAEAHDKAALLRKVAMAGRDPVTERDKDRQSVATFEKAAVACHADLKSSWSKRQEETFLTSLQRHAYPAIGQLPVDKIQASDIPPFLQHGPDGRGGFHAARGCMQDVPRLPYRLPELLAADPAQPVFVVEGEKDADRLRTATGGWTHTGAPSPGFGQP